MTDTGWFPGRLPGDPIGRVPPQGVGGHGASLIAAPALGPLAPAAKADLVSEGRSGFR